MPSKNKNETTSIIAEMVELSESILSSIEDGEPLEEIISKCKKLARLRKDDNALKWFILELNGYDYSSLPSGVESTDVYPIAVAAGRGFQYTHPITKKNEARFWPDSVPSLETQNATSQISLDNLKPPANYTPAITKGSDSGFMGGATYLRESYQDVLNAIRIQQNALVSSINTKKTLLAKIRSHVYDYVLSINFQLKFENVTESLFQETKLNIDKKLQEISPDIMKKFVAAYDRLHSGNPEEWSQAMSSCRNALKAFVDSVFPPKKEIYVTRDKRPLEVTDIRVKNRLIAYIDTKSRGNSKKLLIARTSDLEDRLRYLEDMLSQGTHEGITKKDVNMCVIETYFLLGSLLDV